MAEKPASEGRANDAVRRGLGMIGIATGIALGAGLGYAYYRLVGCSTGACPLTSNPWISTMYGAIMGGLVGGAFGGG